MKKVLSLVLAFVMLCSLVACSTSTSSNRNSSKNPEIVAYMEKNEDDLIDAFEDSFAASSGMTCRCTWEVKGDGLIFNVRITELEDLSEEEKEIMQDAYDDADSMFEGTLEAMQTDIPSLEYLKINICEKGGDLIATIMID